MEKKELQTDELCERWVSVLRMKASEYEHDVRKNGGAITSPSLDDICNEMKSFFIGLKK